MPQGKMKVKSKLPAKAKPQKKAAKGPAVTKRGNRPISPKKQKHDESQKLKKIITKTVNAAMEDDLRAQALDGKRSLRVRKEVAPAPAPKQTKKKGKK
uniref:Uncharacterized protein n=1 Tax=Timema douglasi TaxID=61478 RepID=A0A7R8Z9K2_TIMDO|nr:unnamed protein product [Timema douglasi]